MALPQSTWPSFAARRKFFFTEFGLQISRMDAIKFASQGFLLDEYMEDESYLRRLKATVTADSQRVAKYGWLDKEGHVRRNWNSRWFHLSSQRSTDSLLYFSDQMVLFHLDFYEVIIVDDDT